MENSLSSKAVSYEALKEASLQDLRKTIRRGAYQGHTAGLAEGYLQANLVILPEKHALDFMRYCLRNPKPCPLVAVSDTGSPHIPTAGRDIDVRTDVPAYYVYKNGVFDKELCNLNSLWRTDFVSFLLGCSFTFEHALQKAGITLWHIENNTTVPMFRTNIATVKAGPFGGDMVVSMRMIPQERVKETVTISRPFTLAHGAPIFWGDPRKIGISNIDRPDWGEPVPAVAGHVPMFWACGVTPQVALEYANIPICITHKPGAMIVTDIAEDAENPILAYENALNQSSWRKL